MFTKLRSKLSGTDIPYLPVDELQSIVGDQYFIAKDYWARICKDRGRLFETVASYIHRIGDAQYERAFERMSMVCKTRQRAGPIAFAFLEGGKSGEYIVDHHLSHVKPTYPALDFSLSRQELRRIIQTHDPRTHYIVPDDCAMAAKKLIGRDADPPQTLLSRYALTQCGVANESITVPLVGATTNALSYFDGFPIHYDYTFRMLHLSEDLPYLEMMRVNYHFAQAFGGVGWGIRALTVFHSESGRYHNHAPDGVPYIFRQDW
jgi:hypothetical protein